MVDEQTVRLPAPPTPPDPPLPLPLSCPPTIASHVLLSPAYYPPRTFPLQTCLLLTLPAHTPRNLNQPLACLPLAYPLRTRFFWFPPRPFPPSKSLTPLPPLAHPPGLPTDLSPCCVSHICLHPSPLEDSFGQGTLTVAMLCGVSLTSHLLTRAGVWTDLSGGWWRFGRGWWWMSRPCVCPRILLRPFPPSKSLTPLPPLPLPPVLSPLQIRLLLFLPLAHPPVSQPTSRLFASRVSVCIHRPCRILLVRELLLSPHCAGFRWPHC